MALGVIPPLCASLSPVLAGLQGCSRGQWRSGPSKWRHTATLGGRGQGAPRTCRCIETVRVDAAGSTATSRQGAPRTCRCIETSFRQGEVGSQLAVREHHAPVGALRHPDRVNRVSVIGVREHHAPVGALRPVATMATNSREMRQGAPRTCRCIETNSTRTVSPGLSSQGAPRTCRCIETSPRPVGSGRTPSSSPSSSAAGSRRVAYERVGRTGPRRPGSQR